MKNDVKEKKYNMSVTNLAKIFNSIENLDFSYLPVFTESSEFERDFITTIVLSVGEKPEVMNEMFQAMTGESRDFSEDNLDELCEVAQGFFDNTPSRFKDMLRTTIDGQKQQRSLAIAQMTNGLMKTMEGIKDQISAETHTTEQNLNFDQEDLIQKK